MTFYIEGTTVINVTIPHLFSLHTHVHTESEKERERGPVYKMKEREDKNILKSYKDNTSRSSSWGLVRMNTTEEDLPKDFLKSHTLTEIP